MAPSKEAAAYLPTLRGANVGLPESQPIEEQRLCALLLYARVLRRERWSEIQDLRQREYDALKGNELPLVGEPGAAYHVIGREIGQSSEWFRCRVDHYFDKLVELHETWVPSALRFSALQRFESALEWHIMSAVPPDALRCHDLTPRSVGGAYRAAQTERAPDFHGFDFGDTIDLAQNAVDGLLRRGEAIQADIRAWAWPLLYLRYEEGDRVLFFDPAGALHVFTGEEATE